MLRVMNTRFPALPSTLRIVIAVLVVLAIASITRPVSAADYFKGREVYGTHCEGCHGADGRSSEPGVPDFSSGDGMVQTDAELLKKLREGTSTMPAFRGILKDSEIRGVIAYLRSLQK